MSKAISLDRGLRKAIALKVSVLSTCSDLRLVFLPTTPVIFGKTQDMPNAQFHNEFTLTETATKLGKEALDLGLIPSFVVRYYQDSQQFYISDQISNEPLTPEQAYLQLKKLVESSNL